MQKARILTGNLKGRRFEILSTPTLRPTLEKVKEAIFQMIEIKDNHSVLDLFAGTGALGIECLSQGANFIQYVERDIKNAKLIKSNLASLDISRNRYSVFITDFKIALKKLNKSFDLILIDPPFDKVRYYSDSLIMILNNKKLTTENTLIMVESRKLNKITIPEEYEVIIQKFYGDSEINILKLKK